MQRHDFLISPNRKDPRTERRRSQHGKGYKRAGGRSLSLADWFFTCLAPEYGGVLTVKHKEMHSGEQPINPSSAKQLYLEAMQSLERDRLQPTWGRIQQKGEADYEPVLARMAAFKSHRAVEKRAVLEDFVGFVDQIDGDVAYVTLTPNAGEPLYGEYPAAELKARGIRERRRFTCRTIEAGPHVEMVLEPIPDCEVSEERERAIEEELRNLLGDDDGPQDDY